MVTKQQWSVIAKIIGHALLDVSAELEDERELPGAAGPDRHAAWQAAREQAPDMTFLNQPLTVLHEIGLGGNGLDPDIPECPLCYARGGGGHGGFCPNATRVPMNWVDEIPVSFRKPPYPKGRTPWT